MRAAAKPQVGNFTVLAEAPTSRQEMHTIVNLMQFFHGATTARGDFGAPAPVRVATTPLACPQVRQPALRPALQTWAWRVNLANR